MLNTWRAGQAKTKAAEVATSTNEKLAEIHILVNSNLVKAKETAAKALEEVERLQQEVAQLKDVIASLQSSESI